MLKYRWDLSERMVHIMKKAKYLLTILAILLSSLFTPMNMESQQDFCYSKTKNNKITNNSSGFVQVGKKLYYGIHPKNNMDILKIYQCNANGKNKKYLGSVNHGEHLRHYYNNKLYIETHTPDGSECDYTYINTYEFNLRTKKAKKIMDNCGIRNTRTNILLGIPNSGDYSPTTLYLYNLKTKKKICISKNADGSSVSDSKKVYYVDFDNFAKNGYGKYVLRNCNLKGKNKKTVVRFEADAIAKITTKYVVYQNGYGDDASYYKYTYKTRKTTKTNNVD